jgi:uncharacterized protein YndB with AHSA1/START domain
MNPLKASLVAIALLVAGTGCTTVRLLREPSTLAPNGHAERTRAEHALDYSIAIKIAAPPAVIWKILTDAPAYPAWNTTVIKLDGPITLGSGLELVSKDAPDKTFDLKVTTFEAPLKMVWEDGGSMFLGVRTFTLIPAADGTTTFAMSETLSGGMLGMIEGSLPDFGKSFDAFAADLKKLAESQAAAPAAP